MGKMKGRVSIFALKLDMSKLYDRLKWQFLSMVLKWFGFNQEIHNLIMLEISSTSFYIILNGNLGGYFKPARRIRQGCPPLIYSYNVQRLYHA